jgi:hypothetical protein
MRDHDYKEIAERMKADAFHKGCDITVLTEDIDDNEFWRRIIENVKPNLNNKIDFANPSSKGTRGKHILKKFKDSVTAKFIICIDSDCEYLYDNSTWYMADYIYHTVVYSKENFQCNYFALNEICKDLTDKSYDFKSLLEHISLKISPLFYIWLYFKENNCNDFNHLINKTAFEKSLSFHDIQLNNIGDEDILFQAIENRVNGILQELKNSMDECWYNSIFPDEISNIKQRLTEQYSIRQEDVLSFCYGHGVLEKFVQPFMKKLIQIFRDLRIREVKQDLSNASEQNINNTINHIKTRAKKNLNEKLNGSFQCLIYGNVENQYLKIIKEKLMTELNFRS